MTESHQGPGATVAPPMRARHLVAALGAALFAGSAPGTAVAGDPIMPLSQLRPGMQCTGYSVIRGTDISSFDVEIVDVVSGDASFSDGPRILVRVSGPAIDRTGVGPGFSGSPIYCRDPARTPRHPRPVTAAPPPAPPAPPARPRSRWGGPAATPCSRRRSSRCGPPRPTRRGRGRSP